AIDSGQYSYQKVNVSSQQKDPASFLHWMERMISTRKYSPQLSFGQWFILENDSDTVLSFYYEWKYDIVVILLNFSASDTSIKIDTRGKTFRNLTEIFSNQPYENKVDRIGEEMEVSGYGYRWFRCTVH
ncbi:MAG: hypothetical protein R6U64_03395, partial [Bacteroidales bacterium]